MVNPKKPQPCEVHVWKMREDVCPDCVYDRANKPSDNGLIDTSCATQALTTACSLLSEDEARHVVWLAERENRYSAMEMARTYFTQNREQNRGAV